MNNMDVQSMTHQRVLAAIDVLYYIIDFIVCSIFSMHTNAATSDQRDNYLRKLSRQCRVDGVLVISLSPDDTTASNFRQAGMPVVLRDAYSPLLTSLVVNTCMGELGVHNLIAQTAMIFC
jgi:DNA-binding LacI/PurR family transcriptional regulator